MNVAPPRSALVEWLLRPPRPITTTTVFLITAATGIAQLIHPALFDRFCRAPDRVAAGEWWRLGTAMFFQDGWTAGLLFNLVILLVFGAIAERVLGRWRWVLLYFGCGLFGQVVSYLWLRSTGAGNSMCVAGLVGALTIAALRAPDRFGPRRPARPILYAVPALAVFGAIFHDNHGLPVLLGMAVGYPLLPRDRPEPRT
ncbi:rhomboid family intramembrane serine protease [Nocardia sp. CDC159]|uniref:Rhomboid family intramembrane serine protease n=1 Tax=Nocardia pulmonis TaxID=2951408 RepID=A0A9X2EDL7_9NOCA|nr:MULTISPECIES: rhomboid family intramembrane serine protease [Nocardia]MCM6776161.1 rhomboid family intramembrane serine protease [Nocardia pulmonis]MCM6788512.1 rhomboid family intramembrane serine protease [Nocardia sp. CDC159]